MISATLEDVVTKMGLAITNLTNSQQKQSDQLTEQSNRLTEQSDRLTAAMESLTESDKRLTESDKRLTESNKRLTESDKKLAESNKRLTEMMGNLGGKLGVIIELLLIPGICPLMNKHGHDFVRVCPNIKVRKDKIHTQIDLMLYNTTEAMAIEIKTQIDVEDVLWHTENRIKKMLDLQKEFGIEDKTIYGAVAGISIDDRARKVALDKGLYVIEIRENEKIPLKAEKPRELRIWKKT
ncbi:MAG: hypothetical protein LBU70_03390 [Chitinispirillales bacterium]|jgi:hypothetical protein|nr:hypothetical protein [Chitinispirillales bacterium]